VSTATARPHISRHKSPSAGRQDRDEVSPLWATDPDLVSEANLGLMQAVKRFEPERGFRLATYAMWWIKASVQEYVLRSWSLVKMGTTSFA
jgi:RNA polymerase sigma factor (sigma-70 family)